MFSAGLKYTILFQTNKIYKMGQTKNNLKIPALRKTPVMSSADIDLLNLSNQNKELWRMLEQISIIMWESYMIQNKNFGREDGRKIMEVLEQWAERH